jgi:hypothetical protein
MPSLFGSFGSDLERLAIALGLASPRMSTGLLWLQAAGSSLLKASMISGERAASFAAVGDQRICGEHARSAGVGQDGQAAALRARLFAEHLGHVEQFGNAVDPQDAAAAEGNFEHLVAAGQRTGVGSGSLGSSLGASRLDDDDRFGQRHFAGSGEERPGVADRFHVDDDALGVRIVSQIIDEVAPVHVQHRADRDEGTEADVLAQAPVEDGGAQRAALADEAHTAAPGDRAGKGRVQPVVGSSRPGSSGR